jgi:hypothetical protein
MFSGSWVVPCGQLDGQTDIHDEVIVTFHNFANVPKNDTGFLCVIAVMFRDTIRCML